MAQLVCDGVVPIPIVRIMRSTVPFMVYQGPRKTPRFSAGDRSGLVALDKNACSRIDSVHGRTT